MLESLRSSRPDRAACLSRRAFIASAAGGLALPGLWAGCAGTHRYAGLRTGRYLGEVRIESRVAGEEVFLEGPAVDRTGAVYFTDIPASNIHRWDPAARQLTVFRRQAGRANGLLFDPEGRLLACEADRVTRTDLGTGTVEVLADGYEGHPLEAPNDLTLDGQGRIYFTSRPSGHVPAKGYVNAVYRIDPDGAVHQILREPEVQMPNGLVTSPDDRLLYLIEAHPDAGRHRHVKAYDLSPDGTVSSPRVLYDFYPGRSGDGMCIDAEGNLYVAAGLHARRATSETLDTRPGIHVISPEGRLLAFARTPEDTITNCTFGGEDLRTLYVTCGSLLLSLRTGLPGKPTYRPNP